MEKEKKIILYRYLACLGVGAVMIFFVFALKGFFQEDTKANMQLLHDAFFSTGALMILFSGLMYVSGEGAFLGIGYALSWTVKTLFPFGRKTQETYQQYRERKLGKGTKKGDHCILFTGLFFFLISLIFLVIWYQL